jgi:hypothetical protein
MLVLVCARQAANTRRLSSRPCSPKVSCSPVGVAAEVALEVRPAPLPSVRVELAVAVPAIRDHDPWVVGADQRGELLARL